MAKSPATAETKPFTVVLPAKAAERLEILVETGLYGSSRAEVAKMIILQHLQELWKSANSPAKPEQTLHPQQTPLNPGLRRRR